MKHKLRFPRIQHFDDGGSADSDSGATTGGGDWGSAGNADFSGLNADAFGSFDVGQSLAFDAAMGGMPGVTTGPGEWGGWGSWATQDAAGNWVANDITGNFAGFNAPNPVAFDPGGFPGGGGDWGSAGLFSAAGMNVDPGANYAGMGDFGGYGSYGVGPDGSLGFSGDYSDIGDVGGGGRGAGRETSDIGNFTSASGNVLGGSNAVSGLNTSFADTAGSGRGDVGGRGGGPASYSEGPDTSEDTPSGMDVAADTPSESVSAPTEAAEEAGPESAAPAVAESKGESRGESRGEEEDTPTGQDRAADEGTPGWAQANILSDQSIEDAGNLAAQNTDYTTAANMVADDLYADQSGPDYDGPFAGPDVMESGRGSPYYEARGPEPGLRSDLPNVGRDFWANVYNPDKSFPQSMSNFSILNTIANHPLNPWNPDNVYPAMPSWPVTPGVDYPTAEQGQQPSTQTVDVEDSGPATGGPVAGQPGPDNAFQGAIESQGYDPSAGVGAIESQGFAPDAMTGALESQGYAPDMAPSEFASNQPGMTDFAGEPYGGFSLDEPGHTTGGVFADVLDSGSIGYPTSPDTAYTPGAQPADEPGYYESTTSAQPADAATTAATTAAAAAQQSGAPAEAADAAAAAAADAAARGADPAEQANAAADAAMQAGATPEQADAIGNAVYQAAANQGGLAGPDVVGGASRGQPSAFYNVPAIDPVTAYQWGHYAQQAAPQVETDIAPPGQPGAVNYGPLTLGDVRGTVYGPAGDLLSGQPSTTPAVPVTPVERASNWDVGPPAPPASPANLQDPNTLAPPGLPANPEVAGRAPGEDITQPGPSIGAPPDPRGTPEWSAPPRDAPPPGPPSMLERLSDFLQNFNPISPAEARSARGAQGRANARNAARAAARFGSQPVGPFKLNSPGTFLGGAPQGMVVHHTSGREKSAEDVANSLRGNKGASSQFAILRDGTIVQLMPDNMRAGHASTHGKYIKGQLTNDSLNRIGKIWDNSNTIGVEVVGSDEPGEQGHPFLGKAGRGEPTTPAERAAVARLYAELAAKFGWDPKTSIYGHGEISENRHVSEGAYAADIRSGLIALPDVRGQPSAITQAQPSVSPTEVAARATPAQAGRGPGGSPGHSAQGYAYSPQQSYQQAQNLAQARGQMINDLRSNPALMQQFNNILKGEVRGLDKRGQLMAAEMLLNRAAANAHKEGREATGKDLANWLNNRGEFRQTLNKLDKGRDLGPDIDVLSMLSQLERGSNYANFATTNASAGFKGAPYGSYGSQRGAETARSGKEGFGIQHGTGPWATAMGFPGNVFGGPSSFSSRGGASGATGQYVAGLPSKPSAPPTSLPAVETPSALPGVQPPPAPSFGREGAQADYGTNYGRGPSAVVGPYDMDIDPGGLQDATPGTGPPTNQGAYTAAPGAPGGREGVYGPQAPAGIPANSLVPSMNQLSPLANPQPPDWPFSGWETGIGPTGPAHSTPLNTPVVNPHTGETQYYGEAPPAAVAPAAPGWLAGQQTQGVDRGTFADVATPGWQAGQQQQGVTGPGVFANPGDVPAQMLQDVGAPPGVQQAVKDAVEILEEKGATPEQVYDVVVETLKDAGAPAQVAHDVGRAAAQEVMEDRSGIPEVQQTVDPGWLANQQMQGVPQAEFPADEYAGPFAGPDVMGERGVPTGKGDFQGVAFDSRYGDWAAPAEYAGPFAGPDVMGERGVAPEEAGPTGRGIGSDWAATRGIDPGLAPSLHAISTRGPADFDKNARDLLAQVPAEHLAQTKSLLESLTPQEKAAIVSGRTALIDIIAGKYGVSRGTLEAMAPAGALAGIAKAQTALTAPGPFGKASTQFQDPGRAPPDVQYAGTPGWVDPSAPPSVPTVIETPPALPGVQEPPASPEMPATPTETPSVPPSTSTAPPSTPQQAEQAARSDPQTAQQVISQNPQAVTAISQMYGVSMEAAAMLLLWQLANTDMEPWKRYPPPALFAEGGRAEKKKKKEDIDDLPLETRLLLRKFHIPYDPQGTETWPKAPAPDYPGRYAGIGRELMRQTREAELASRADAVPRELSRMGVRINPRNWDNFIANTPRSTNIEDRRFYDPTKTDETMGAGYEEGGRAVHLRVPSTYGTPWGD